MFICLDAGNSRLKWGVWDNSWKEQGALTYSQSGQIASIQQRWNNPPPQIVLLSFVNDDERLNKLLDIFGSWKNQKILKIVQSQQNYCGVTNLYKNPSQLGVDRWCALIGAWNKFHKSAIVVMAGTATTIDALDDKGNFLGGTIMPGIGLMKKSLAQDTAKLPYAKGIFADVNFAQCTEDAIISGIIEAHLGAIQRAAAKLQNKLQNKNPDFANKKILTLISGGNAKLLAKSLNASNNKNNGDFFIKTVDNLPLEGLRFIAEEQLRNKK